MKKVSVPSCIVFCAKSHMYVIAVSEQRAGEREDNHRRGRSACFPHRIGWRWKRRKKIYAKNLQPRVYRVICIPARIRAYWEVTNARVNRIPRRAYALIFKLGSAIAGKKPTGREKKGVYRVFMCRRRNLHSEVQPTIRYRWVYCVPPVENYAKQV